MPPTVSIAAPVATRAAAAPRLDADALAEIVAGLAQADSLWRPHVQHDAVERARVRLLATAAYEVWLLGWTPGQSVGLHDHGGSNGAYQVVDGVLTESTVSPDGAVVQRNLVVGDGGRIEAGSVHDLANRSGGLVTSLHAYSRPLQSMGFYDGLPAGTRGHRVRTYWVEAVNPILA